MDIQAAKTVRKKAVPSTFGERVKGARENLKISQGELGRRLGVSRAAVSQWEDGTTKEVKGKHLDGLVRVLKRPKEYLLHGKEGGKVDLSDDAYELAHAWDQMPEGEWKQRVFYFVTTFGVLGRQYQGEQQLNQAKHIHKGKKIRGRTN